MIDLSEHDFTQHNSEIVRLRAALDKIAAMDPWGNRADDLGRAARIAREAVDPVSGASTPDE